MKRVRRAFASGARVYAAGAELPDNHPVVKAAPGLFEAVPGSAKPSRSRKPKGKADDGQEQKDDPGADGDT